MGLNGTGTEKVGSRGGMLRQCIEPGCHTFTLGGWCVEHDRGVVADIPRGVPHLEPVPASMEDAWTPVADPRLARA